VQLPPSPTVRISALIFSLLLFCPAHAVTLAEIESTPNLTPDRFAHFFSHFEFRYHNEVQSADTFLATEAGDCDDYAILAADVLRKRGYNPRLIAVRMPKVVHVVCYVPEVNAYLDYNERASETGLVASGATIPEIARHVAHSYGAKWSTASEFTFQQGAKRLVQTVMPGAEKQLASATRRDF
jgi:hypothetical protein